MCTVEKSTIFCRSERKTNGGWSYIIYYPMKSLGKSPIKKILGRGWQRRGNRNGASSKKASIVSTQTEPS